MWVLGIETSCDETAAALVEDGTRIHSNVIADQADLHAPYGGVVPELAGRRHIEQIDRVIQQALTQANVSLSGIDLIAVTVGPGLIGSLLVGLNVARGLAYTLKIPLVPVNHLEGHLFSIFLQEKVEFPYLALSVSGGHTDLYRVDSIGHFSLLGRTRDDAAGEAFDKVAKMMGLGYPGGPVIEKTARGGNPATHQFPRPLLERDSLDFSFSGLKTSVRNLLIKREGGVVPWVSDADIAAGFQEAAVDVLVTKVLRACEQENLCRVVVTGGVAANGVLRERIQMRARERGIGVFIPQPVFCTDNAAMIACAGYFRFQENPDRQADVLYLDAQATLPVDG
ncbi:MAG: tRNA (adenosine(37)-N6)-threonylcarbamoyltransferase complex transferase subunit TsaD [Nitrospinae bacterium CG11_big_fil_rev_8_21_14_0_20_56_8]|nr:MAG: tRNA (adenosine(37)-N6)-threonylcarbamoyltransferase complex transferase subunit TsaD [Nitrospinae bacterium CG11_big_fil_rev_8_21_14_0_20_56_8]